MEIGSLLAGTVTEVSVREGDRVEQGVVLVRLKDEEARASVAQARSAVAQAEAGVAQALAGAAAAAARLMQLHSTTLPAAEQGVRIAAAELESARRNFERVDALVSQGMLARANLDEARRALDTAQGRLDREKTLAEGSRPGGGDERAAQAAVAQADAAVAQARSAVVQARAALAAVEARLADLVVRAPAAGTHHRPLGRGGRHRSARADPAGALAARAHRDHRARRRKESRAARRRAESRRLGRRLPGADLRRGTGHAGAGGRRRQRHRDGEVRRPRPPGYLLPEMTVSVEIEVARKAGALTLPLDAVRDLASAPWVLAVRDGRARRVPVGVGVRGATRVEILSGLAAGDRVIPAAEGKVADGDKVRVKE